MSDKHQLAGIFLLIQSIIATNNLHNLLLTFFSLSFGLINLPLFCLLTPPKQQKCMEALLCSNILKIILGYLSYYVEGENLSC